MHNRHKIAALKRGAERTAKVVKAVEDAMCLVAEEMSGNAGIYPHNGGSVSIAEILRRAGVNEATLYKSSNAELKGRVGTFIDGLKRKGIVGRERVKKTYQVRLEELQERFDAVHSERLVLNLQLQQAQAEIVSLRERNDQLLSENEAQIAQMRNGGTVTAIRGVRRSSK